MNDIIFDSNTTIVLDIGSSYTKIGFSNEELPSLIYTSKIGIPKYQKVLPSNYEKKIVGPAENNFCLFNITSPVVRSKYNDFDGIALLIEKGFNDLKIANKNINLLVTIPPFLENNAKKELFQVLFEIIDVSNAYLGTQGPYGIYANGLSSGVSIESGSDCTHITPVIEGYSIKNNIDLIELGGLDVTNYLEYSIKNFGVRNRFTKETINFIKENYGYCSDISGNNTKLNYEKIKLPDGSEVELDNKILNCGPVLFTPQSFGIEMAGLSDLIINTIKKCPIEIRKDLYQNICISGGNTMIANFKDYLSQYLKDDIKNNVNINVVGNDNRKYNNWIGASIVSSFNSFNQMWISKADYNEKEERILFENN